ncbi:MAG TPA: hypothetical protein ENI34_05200 [candidate division WOR-3 bacterium]|uniref:T9SS type A sorting domain-containing protein n=1 Tax=candidate division WOR-3 bacterium TaxID=2052148 RepID=A0A9C9EME1_UNCW3|nr:hypothetical protein [candidate division WOR-3 bacterium]
MKGHFSKLHYSPGLRSIIISIFLSTISLPGRPLVQSEIGLRNFEIKKHDINNVELCISNFGKFGQTQSYSAGGWWPRGSEHNYIFGAGPCFGTIDRGSGDTLVSVGYNPIDGTSEFAPGIKDMDPNDPLAVIYIFPELWPPPEATYSMAPQQSLSHQDSWCAYNDLDINYHSPGNTWPIGLEVYQTVYAWSLEYSQNMIFIKYEFKNVSGGPLKNCYIGINADNDIGEEYPEANDRIAGIVKKLFIIDGDSLQIDNLVYQWQDEAEASWTEFPGVIGFDYLQTPWDLVKDADKDSDGILDQYEKDSAYYCTNLPDSMWDVDFDALPDWRDPSEIPQLGMTAFKRFYTGFNEPWRDANRYLCLAGYNYKTGVYEPWDTAASPPDDQRYLQCTGPFDLEEDSIVVIIIAITFADWYNIYLSPDSAIVQVDDKAQFLFDKNWLLPNPPPPPNLQCIPGDAQVTLIWDNVAETTPDPYYEIVSHPGTSLYNPFYKKYDFEGYRVWKSRTGEIGDWCLLAQYDLTNGITFEDSTEVESLRIKATDVGLRHIYIDQDVRNGFEYTYAVTAFDYNYLKQDTIDSLGNPIQIPEPVWYETGKFLHTAVPRREPANFIAGSCSVTVLSGNPLLSEDLEYEIVYPLAMKDTTLFAEFASIKYDSSSQKAVYTFYYRNEGKNIRDSIHIYSANQNTLFDYVTIPLYGVALDLSIRRDSLPTDESIFERIEVVSGAYPESLLTPSLPGPWASYFAFWSYRGNDYEVHWISTTGRDTANSVIVIDAMSRDTIFYSPYNPESSHEYDSLADGWCFLSLLGVSDTLVLYGAPAAVYNTKYLYINGGLVGLKKGGFLQPGDILPRSGELWYVYADTSFHPAPANACFEVNLTSAYFDTLTSRQLNVKVVPNPFLVYNEWSTSLDAPKIRFINLPSECTIRIFTLNGELIKTLRHHHTAMSSETGESVKGGVGGDEWWNLISETNHEVASGIYIFHIDSDIGEQVGKFVVIR